MEEKKERTQEVIQSEYRYWCEQLGHLTYQAHVISQKALEVHHNIHKLNIEADKLIKKEQDSKEVKENESH